MMRSKPSFVYFIRPVGADGPVKIGCSQIPAGRLKTIALWSPVPLEIVATIPGNEDLESRFHAQLFDDWMHGEWFSGSALLTNMIDAIAAGDFDVNILPASRSLPRTMAPQSPERKLRSRYAMRVGQAFRRHRFPWVARELCLEIETASGERLAEVTRTLDAMIADPSSYALTIERLHVQSRAA